MMDLVHFTFSSFWHFAGMCLLIEFSATGIAQVVKAFRKEQRDE